MIYVTTATVAASLNDPLWAGSGDADRAVKMANAWLSSKRLPTNFDPIPQAVLDAGAEVAKEAAAGNLYKGRTEGVVKSKESSAQTGTHTKKTYADGADGQSITAGEQLALALIDPYVTKGFAINALLSRT